MAERTHIPGSAACGECETLLADALDGLLQPADEARFAAHQAVCLACAAMVEEARKGREWLEFLSPEPDAPAGLLEKILAQTGPGNARLTAGMPTPVAAGAGTVPAFVPPVWQQPNFLARMRSSVQPRLLMTAAMAFFSIALTLNVTGVRLWNVHVTALRLADLRPGAVRSHMERQLTMASVPIVRYFDHLRFLYEVESSVRELRGESEDNVAPPQKQGQPVTEDRKPGNYGTREQGSKGTREPKNGSPEMAPAIGEAGGILETFLAPQDSFARSGGPAVRKCERSTPWIA